MSFLLGRIPRFSPSFSISEAVTAARYLSRDGDELSVVRKFEGEFADFIGAKHAVMVPSARYGFHLLLKCWGFGAGGGGVRVGGEGVFRVEGRGKFGGGGGGMLRAGGGVVRSAREGLFGAGEGVLGAGGDAIGAGRGILLADGRGVTHADGGRALRVGGGPGRPTSDTARTACTRERGAVRGNFLPTRSLAAEPFAPCQTRRAGRVRLKPGAPQGPIRQAPGRIRSFAPRSGPVGRAVPRHSLAPSIRTRPPRRACIARRRFGVADRRGGRGARFGAPPRGVLRPPPKAIRFENALMRRQKPFPPAAPPPRGGAVSRRSAVA